MKLNKCLLVSELESLSISQSWQTRLQVANHKNITPKIIERIFYEEKNIAVRCALAKNNNTPLWVLVALSHESEQVRKSVAKNTNLSPDVLMKMAKDESEEVRRLVAQNINISGEILSILSDDEALSVRESLASNTNISCNIYEKLARDSDKVRSRLASNINIPLCVQRMLVDDESQEVRRSLAGCVNLSHGLATKLAWDASVYVKEPLIHNPVTQDWPSYMLVLLLCGFSNPLLPVTIKNKLNGFGTQEDFDPTVDIACNHKCPPTVLRELALSDRSSIVGLIACNKNTPLDVLSDFVGSNCKDLRASVASNPGLTEDLVNKLSTDEECVRVELAQNSALSRTSLEFMSRDDSSTVRYNVSNNANTSTAVLKNMVEDSDIKVRSSVFRNLARRGVAMDWINKVQPDDVILSLAANSNNVSRDLEYFGVDINEKMPVDLRVQVASNTSDPSIDLSFFASDRSSKVRASVARNINASPAVLTLLASDKVSYVRSCVAINPITPRSSLEMLAREKDLEVLWRVAINPSVTDNVLNKIIKNKSEDVRASVVEVENNTSINILKKLACDKSYYVRFCLSRRLSMPEEIWKMLLRDKSEDIRSFVVFGNQSTMDFTLDALCQLENCM